MKVIIAGGGTGGHLFPGIAVAQELLDRSLAQDVVFVGTEHGIEAKVIPREGFPIRYLRAEGFVGKSVLGKAKALSLFALALIEARRIVRSLKPDLVIGVGGYASVPAVMVARLMGIPTLIHEQNSVPGLANRMLSRLADTVAVTYQESIAYFPDHKTYLTGNPVRKQMVKRSIDEALAVFPLERGLSTVFVFGGSAGARSINHAVVEALNYLYDLRHSIQFIHQTGEKDHEKVTEAYRRLGFAGVVVPFIYQMAEAYSVADLVICRAGATTLAEITALGKAAILVPYPYAASNHQEHNAGKLVDMGAARMIRDGEANGEALASLIRDLVSNRALRVDMERRAAAFGRPDAAEKIAHLAQALTRRRERGSARRQGA
jgi:UDP-N-acetylglucosamine--N-acetylmuramyl-(pentapeptide) pyrophosphoryl-undecaprenol N-acetylglucosamine transferase